MYDVEIIFRVVSIAGIWFKKKAAQITLYGTMTLFVISVITDAFASPKTERSDKRVDLLIAKQPIPF